MATLDNEWLPGWTTDSPAPGDWLLLVSGTEILKPAEGWLVPVSKPEFSAEQGAAVSLGTLGGQPVFVAGNQAGVSPELEAVSLRDALLMAEDVPAGLLSTGFQLWQWWHDHRYCGRCGTETGMHATERAKWCEPCAIPWYPRLAPCVIVVIRKDDRMLLAKSSRVKRHFYSLIAGFVEPGESLESAVGREVKEETGLDVTNIRYFSSQPWPFPHQLMVGFFADYAGGELILQEDELVDADWFVPGQMPPVPPDTTIAGRLIQAMACEIARKGASL
ncbi:NAD(+) diphosphatase [Marinobacter salinisoli]|uniref:NAD(+) diphosphatase n=1 Tax=Marinobacter salinisoli TaxID=2769486 RepID=A0ABX7MVI7_9GAMM|nr:NAD(+) diphosphatase [Marinobacter salinisoli]QSP96324.1 NAD(+) diphosphatase [Marinobacter salinisoli]